MNWVSPIKDSRTLRLYEQELMNLDPKYFIMFRMGVGTGMQVQELLKLSVGDVRDRKSITVFIGTKRLRRLYQFEPDLKQVIGEYTQGRDRTSPLFLGQKGCPISREQCYRAMKAAGEKLGLGYVGAQTMRKTFAWRYYKNTGDINFLSHLMNHASPSVTYRFIGEKEKVAPISAAKTPLENVQARYALFENESGIARMEQIRDMLSWLEEEIRNPEKEDAFYGRVDTLLNQMEELIDEFNSLDEPACGAASFPVCS